MKTIAAVLLFVALAHSAQMNYSPEFIEKVTSLRVECAKMEAVDPKHLARLDSIEDFPTFEEIKCHSLCMLKQLKLLNDDQTVKIEEVKPILKEDILEKFIATINVCLPEDQKFDTCEKTYNSHVCVLKNM